MTNAPESRQTHVIRILGTNEAGDIVPEIWADVERFDIFKAELTGTSDQSNNHQFKFRWCDDPNSQEYEPDGNPSRTFRMVKVCDPKNLDNPTEWIPIQAIVDMKSVGSLNNFQGQQYRFAIKESSDAIPMTSRDVEKRR